MKQSIRFGKTFTLNPPCKINLHLSVKELRPDGYHNLESIFAALGLSDTLYIRILPGNRSQTALSVKNDGPMEKLSRKRQFFPAIPMEKDLIFQAVDLFRLKTDFSANLAIQLIRRIPPGSGLGGSSSNAAAVLLALNHINRGSRLSREKILDLAIQLGCDVPFFIEIALNRKVQSTIRTASGKGEMLSPLPSLPQFGILLVFPGFPSYTAAAYKLLDKKRENIKNADQAFPPAYWNFSNDFLELFLNHGAEKEKFAYKTILQDLKGVGAIFAGLSGSGSACFGIFSSQKEAEQAQKKLIGKFYTVQSSFFLRYRKTRGTIGVNQNGINYLFCD